MSDSASRSAAASDVSGSSRLPSTIEKSHLADSGSESFTSSDRELSVGGGEHSGKSPQSQPADHTSAPLQDLLVHATADLAPLAENDDRSRWKVCLTECGKNQCGPSVQRPKTRKARCLNMSVCNIVRSSQRGGDVHPPGTDNGPVAPKSQEKLHCPDEK